MDDNRFIEAIPPLKRTVALNPDDTDSQYSLGLAYSKLNHYQKARDQFQQVLQLNPNHSGAHEKLALTQRKLKKDSVSASNVFPQELDIILIP
jgi:tetratricopeptide (TPR) repeat protein